MSLRLNIVVGLVVGSLLVLSTANPRMPSVGRTTPWDPNLSYILAQSWGPMLPILPTRPADPAAIPPRLEIERAFLVCQMGYAIGLEVWAQGNKPLQGQIVTLLAINNYREMGWAQREMIGWSGDFKAQLILGLVAQTQGYKAAVVWRNKAWWTDVGPCATKGSLPELGNEKGG